MGFYLLSIMNLRHSFWILINLTRCETWCLCEFV